MDLEGQEQNWYYDMHGKHVEMLKIMLVGWDKSFSKTKWREIVVLNAF